jgi:hypothetical protein
MAHCPCRFPDRFPPERLDFFLNLCEAVLYNIFAIITYLYKYNISFLLSLSIFSQSDLAPVAVPDLLELLEEFARACSNIVIFIGYK